MHQLAPREVDDPKNNMRFRARKVSPQPQGLLSRGHVSAASCACGCRCQHGTLLGKARVALGLALLFFFAGWRAQGAADRQELWCTEQETDAINISMDVATKVRTHSARVMRGRPCVKGVHSPCGG